MIAGDAAAAGQPGNPVTIRAQFLTEWQDEASHGGASGFAIQPEQGAKPVTPVRGHWRQSDVRRAIAAAEQAGLQHYRVEIAPDGTLAIVVGGSVGEGSEVVAARG